MAYWKIEGWTEAEDARLRALWDEGHSTAEIGRRMGRTKSSIVGRKYRLRLPPRPSPIRGTPIRTNSAAALQRAWSRQKQKQHQDGAARAPVQPGRRGNHPGPAAPSIPARAGDPPPGGQSGHVTGVSSPALPPAVATPRPGVFSTGARRGCVQPMWGDRERPTHVYCEAPVRQRPDGTPCRYCPEHAARNFARRASWEDEEEAPPHRVTRSTFAWGGRAA